MNRAIITIAGCTLPIRERKGVRVIALASADVLHGRSPGTFQMLFRANRDRIVSGQDFFGAKRILLAEIGYLVLAKGFHDTRSFQVMRALVGDYFRSAPQAVDSTTNPAVLGQLLAFHENRASELRVLIQRQANEYAVKLPPKHHRLNNEGRIQREPNPVAGLLEASQLRSCLLSFQHREGVQV